MLILSSYGSDLKLFEIIDKAYSVVQNIELSNIKLAPGKDKISCAG